MAQCREIVTAGKPNGKSRTNISWESLRRLKRIFVGISHTSREGDVHFLDAQQLESVEQHPSGVREGNGRMVRELPADQYMAIKTQEIGDRQDANRAKTPRIKIQNFSLRDIRV